MIEKTAAAVTVDETLDDDDGDDVDDTADAPFAVVDCIDGKGTDPDQTFSWVLVAAEVAVLLEGRPRRQRQIPVAKKEYFVPS